MSRILRRPMFRGGRVDSRGTGIASGLSYNNGGRVGYFNGGSSNYTPTSFEDFQEYQKFINSFKPGLFKTNKIYSDAEIDSMVDKGKFANRPWWDLTGIFDLGMGISGPSSDFIQGLQYEKTDAGKRDYKKELIDERDNLLKQAQKYKMAVPEGVELSVAESEGDGTETIEELKARLIRENEEKLQALLKAETEKDPAEEIAKNKKIFQDAYGSGVADDASNMLLSFAGKALKPGADTKSAFGEFFEEEGKRPSERKKYKDAATTAAINAYLTGQKSMADLDRALKINRATMQDKIAYADLATDLEGKDWNAALSIVQERYKGSKKRDSFTVVSETLKGKFGKNVDQKKGNLKDIDADDLIEGFTILTTDTGKIILEKIDGVVKERPDLVI